MSENVGPPVNFAHSDYDYKVTCGSVMAPNSISWEGPTYTCKDWQAVNRLHEMWAQVEDHPAFRVRLGYDGGKVNPP